MIYCKFMIENKFINTHNDSQAVSNTIIAGYFKAGTATIMRGYNKLVAIVEIE